MEGLLQSLQNEVPPRRRAAPKLTEVTQIKRKLKPKERLFCGYYACTGDAELSAKKAGYPKDSALTGDCLLRDDAITEEIEHRLYLQRKLMARLAAIGYRRLAFGSIHDPLQLLFTEQPTPDQLEGLDLFMISEIKRNKDGMLEIKFFDRLKALEKLSCLPEDSGGVAGLFDAIGRHAASGSEDAD